MSHQLDLGRWLPPRRHARSTPRKHLSVRDLRGRFLSWREVEHVAAQVGLVPPPQPVDVFAERRDSPTPHLDGDCLVCRAEAADDGPSLGERLLGFLERVWPA